MDREKLAEDSLEADVAAFGDRDILLEKFVVGIDLKLDEVWWLDGLLQFAEVDPFRHGWVRCRGLVWPGSGGRVDRLIAGNKNIRHRAAGFREPAGMAERLLGLGAGQQMLD
jgi:hypothetical protein